MKISRPDTKSAAELGPSTGIAPAGTGAASNRPEGREAASDQVNLSSLSEYLASAQSGSPAQAAKLGALGAAVSSGQYSPHPHAVSGSVIQHSIEFGSANHWAVR